jgi:RimJ/RimL family protein N-acetyltransferase
MKIMPSLADYNLVFLDKSWEWLNDPEIKALTLTPDFTKEQQKAFYDGLPDRKDYWIKGIMEDGIPVGAMGLKHINNEEAEYWGYIGEKAYWGKGIGPYMLREAIAKAKELELHQLYLHVDEKNLRAKQLYINMGFQLTIAGELEKYHLNL